MVRIYYKAKWDHWQAVIFACGFTSQYTQVYFRAVVQLLDMFKTVLKNN